MGIQRDERGGAASSSTTYNPLIQQFGQLNVLDDMIRLRAGDYVQRPILAYPTSETAVSTYSYYSGRDLNDMIDNMVTVLVDAGFTPPREGPAVVALLTLSDLNMVITFFALSRLGFTVMMLSPRLSGDACVSLLNEVECDTVLYGTTVSIRTRIGEILQRKIMACRPLPQINADRVPERTFLAIHQRRNLEAQRNRIALILHSSGSTGTPKPLYLTHKALMTHPLRGPGLTSFNPLPWYHLHGLSTAIQAMWQRKTAFMWNAALPLTAKSVICALEATRPQSVAAVPYLLQLMVDHPRGIDALRACELVTYGGAPCPDELGDKLVNEGVNFGGSFGLTEAGLVADSISRSKNDPCWNYLRFFDNIKPYIWMKPVGDSLYECVYLKGHPALTTCNSNEPPGSFHSKDVFTPHPTIPERWKYASRIDDRITLVNGEKVLPLPIEGLVKQNVLIHEAVVVGLGKASPGLLVFKSQEINEAEVTDEEYLDAIWPTIQDANSRTERFSQISRDLIAILPYTAKFPRTDKGSMIRAQVYSEYAPLIEDLFSQSEEKKGCTQTDVHETQALILKLCREELLVHTDTANSDFFNAGIDSLKAIQLRRLILRTFKLDKDMLRQNAVYETGTANALAEHICALQVGLALSSADSDRNLMSTWIETFSSFGSHVPYPSFCWKTKSVILTGATGSIGAHILHSLLQDESISAVYCFTRQTSPTKAILDSLSKRRLAITPAQTSRVKGLHCGIDQPNFGLKDKTIEHLRGAVTQIIHAAWPVNFNLPLAHFYPHVQGVYNLIQFSLSVRQPQPALMLFCSSVSTALASPSSSIPESPLNLSSAYMGYGQSKLIGEHIISKARRSGALCYSLRIGQVSGHSEMGFWNDKEALPLMIRSAPTLKALPDLNHTCSWLPVDKLASIIVDIGQVCSSPKKTAVFDHLQRALQMGYPLPGIICSVDSDTVTAKNDNDNDDSIYNISNPRIFQWSALLDSLRRNGFQFETVPFEQWCRMLRESEVRGEEHINPAVKLISHYEDMYGKKSAVRLKHFQTARAEKDSATMRGGDLDMVGGGILDTYAKDWRSRWMSS
ncbi:NRPS-like protein biosynthetic cluster [Penicillium ucsense]|uniref:NRPS-like protein biosynthetic cluster n=1 Tax=Penicillium ucsense TaxID=2839758 RepID=A0A8J8W884_9EURO|nr:NRPS-like protein biosynthetic cluster [Penicillium ucsense]KAF7733763.1 NRPS-like protein biosynthetic cluster [Penicillium ucsense]